MNDSSSKQENKIKKFDPQLMISACGWIFGFTLFSLVFSSWFCHLFPSHVLLVSCILLVISCFLFPFFGDYIFSSGIWFLGTVPFLSFSNPIFSLKLVPAGRASISFSLFREFLEQWLYHSIILWTPFPSVSYMLLLSSLDLGNGKKKELNLVPLKRR